MRKYEVSFFRNLKLLKETAYRKRDRELGLIYKDLRSFMLDAEFAQGRKHAKKMLSMIERSYPEDEMSRVLGISESRVRGIRKELSTLLYSIFGSDLFDDILSEDRERIDRAKRVIDFVLETNSNEELPYWEEIDERSGYSPAEEYNESDLDLNDCFYEASLLHDFSRSELNDRVTFADKKKLKLLIAASKGAFGVEKKLQVWEMIKQGVE